LQWYGGPRKISGYKILAQAGLSTPRGTSTSLMVAPALTDDLRKAAELLAEGAKAKPHFLDQLQAKVAVSM